MAQVFTGAKAVVSIGGAEVGFLGGVNVTQEQTITDVDVLGQLEVGDLAETGHKINFSVNYFKAVGNLDGTGEIGNTAAILGLDTTGAEGTNSMRNQTEFNVLILDDDTDQPIFELQGCKFEGGNGQVDARGVWQGTWNFRARRGFGL